MTLYVSGISLRLTVEICARVATELNRCANDRMILRPEGIVALEVEGGIEVEAEGGIEVEAEGEIEVGMAEFDV